MPNVLIRDLDDDILRQLKAAAKANRRSLQAEIHDVLRRANSRNLAETRRLFSWGLSDERLAAVERAVAEFPSDPELRLEYAGALLTSQPDQVRAEVLRGVELERDEDPRRLMRAARLLTSVRDVDTARSCAEARSSEPAGKR